MLRKISLLTLLTIGNLAYAETVAIPFEVGVTGVAIFEGHSGDALDNDFPGVGIRLGYHFTDKWLAIGEVLYTTPDYGGSSVDVVDYIASVGYDFNKINSVTPYATLGFGYRTISDVADRDNWNLVVGAGIKVPINDSFQFILDGKGRWNLEESEQGMLGTVGINYLF